jgi:hypothetical protein
MSRSAALALLSLALAGHLAAAEPTPHATPEKRGGWFTRMLHPFQSTPAPN